MGQGRSAGDANSADGIARSGSAAGVAGGPAGDGVGDTIRVRQAGRAITVRLACIDAPETAQSPWGQQARSDLQQRLPIGREVVHNVKTTDRYGRTVAELIAGININLVLVEDGQAFADRQVLGGCDARAYLDAEFRASRRRTGLWQVPGGITRPWVFRRPRGSSFALIPEGTSPGDRRNRCGVIGSNHRGQELPRQGHGDLDGHGDGEACASLR